MSEMLGFPENIAVLAKTVFQAGFAYVRVEHVSDELLNAADHSAIAVSRLFCEHHDSIDSNTDCIVIQDAVYDARYRDLPCVVEAPYLRFFAEYRIASSVAGVCALYIADTQPRTSFSPREKDILKALTTLAVEAIERKIDQGDSILNGQATA